MRNTLESEVNKYLNQCKGFIKKEKLTWNEGGELYRVYFEDEEKSLFATSLEESQWNLKERFIEIYNFCRKENQAILGAVGYRALYTFPNRYKRKRREESQSRKARYTQFNIHPFRL